MKAVSGILLTLLLIGMLTLAFDIQPVEASGTIYIRADGSVEPDTAPISSGDNVTYTFTGNIYDEIVVQRDNIVIDGEGYTVQGTGSGTGIYLFYRNNITIKNVEIKWFRDGIYLWCSAHNTIAGNNISNNKQGVMLESADWNIIDDNTILNNSDWGIVIPLLSSASYNVISRNLISDSMDCGILVSGGIENTFWANTIMNCYFGLYLAELHTTTSHNKVYHNSFINNYEHAKDWCSSVNFWDDGYPSGGNYWNDYTGIDVCSGPYQNESGSDGTGDTPYFFDANQDNFPFMFPTFPWDVNRDGRVRIDDVLFVALGFGTYEGGPPNSNGYLYSSRADIAPQPAGDGKIRIDDVLCVALHFGETYI